MKITYVSSSTIPSLTANSIHVMKMCQALTQEGHQVSLLVPRRRTTLSEEMGDIQAHYGIRASFSVSWLREKPFWRGFDYDLRCVLHALHSRSDLLFTRDIRLAALASCISVPVIGEMHDVPVGRGALYLSTFLHGRGFRRLVVITKALHRSLLAVYPGALRGKAVLVAPDGIDLERYAELPEPGDARRMLPSVFPDSRQFVCGYTGHLYAGRGIELILTLAKRFPQIKFLIAGGTPDAVGQCQARVCAAGLENVHLTGFVPNSRVPLYQAACDVLLMPYQRHVSGSSGGDIAGVLSPMKMFEYMAAGRPIISSDLAVFHEVLDESSAIFCAPDDVDAWQHALQRAIADPQWRESLGSQARQNVKQYAWRSRVQHCLAGLPQSRSSSAASATQILT